MNSAANSWSPLRERALRVAARAHHDQTRKASSVSYITHPVAVALILQQYGFHNDEVIAAALLHDVVEDTSTTIGDLSAQFPEPVVDLVAHLSERKYDEAGIKRGWQDRKAEHLAHIRDAPLAARAITLADKLHNLSTMTYDIDTGQDITSRFNASFDKLLGYYEAMIDAAAGHDPALVTLRDDAHAALENLRRRL